MSHPPSPPTFTAFVETWNAEQGLDTPEHHHAIAAWLAANWNSGKRELLLMAFRNSGKSTLVGLFCAWLLTCDPALRILVLAADLALARKMTRNVKRIIERHPMCDGLKPKRADQWAAEQFTVNRDAELRDPSMLAKGIATNVTGSRADVVICDDVEVPNTCDTPGKREDLRERLAEIDYVMVPGGLQLYVGTPHTYHTVYGEAPRRDLGEEQAFLDGFARLVIPVLDDRGRSRWPECFPKSKIETIRRRTGPNKFRSQMLLDPVDITEGRLDPDRLIPYAGELEYAERNGEAVLSLEGRRLVSATCWWDPSFGAPERGDGSAIACVFTSEDGAYWLHRVAYLRFDPKKVPKEPEAEQMCRQVVDFAEALFVPSVTVEANGLGRLLPSMLRLAFQRQGIGCAVVEAYSTQAKELRILEAFDAPLAAGRLYVHDSVQDTSFLSEMREWRPGSRAPDDGLDAVAGCLLAEPVRLPRNPHALTPVRRAGWTGGGQTFHATTTFEP